MRGDVGERLMGNVKGFRQHFERNPEALLEKSILGFKVNDISGQQLGRAGIDGHVERA